MQNGHMTITVRGTYHFAGLAFDYEAAFTDNLKDVIGLDVECGGAIVDAWGIRLADNILALAREKAEDERPTRKANRHD